MGDAQMGLQARLMSQALRKLAGIVSKSNTCLDVHQSGPGEDRRHVRQPGDHHRRPGAQVLLVGADRHPAHQLDQTGRQGRSGNRTKAKVAKNKVAAPFKIAEFDIMYGEGISFTGELLDLGVEHRLVQKSGSWYSYGETRIGQGREAARQFLTDNPDVSGEIEIKLRETLGLLPGTGDAPAEEPDADKKTEKK